MKKFLLIIAVIITIVIVIPKDEPDFRMRIIANSDSFADQKIKMDVVNALIFELKDYDFSKIEYEIKKNINELKQVVASILKNTDFTIGVMKVRFPPKELNNEIIKGGKYKALVVIINEGKGKNWWSLLNSNYKIGYEDIETDDIVFKSYFIEKSKTGIN